MISFHVVVCINPYWLMEWDKTTAISDDMEMSLQNTADQLIVIAARWPELGAPVWVRTVNSYQGVGEIDTWATDQNVWNYWRTRWGRAWLHEEPKTVSSYQTLIDHMNEFFRQRIAALDTQKIGELL